MPTIFDIETGPLPLAELEAIIPAFDPAEVKTGNIKDPAKIAEKLAESERRHKQDFIDRAALDPLTGRVLAIGTLNLGKYVPIYDDDEAKMLRDFWMAWEESIQMIGFNIFQFDLPFLIRRSWKHKVTIPAEIRRGRYWADRFVDLRDVWQMGNRQDHGSLDSISKHMGIGAKTGDGGDFAALFGTDRNAALAYLKNDLELTWKMAERMGVI